MTVKTYTILQLFAKIFFLLSDKKMKQELTFFSICLQQWIIKHHLKPATA